jgi:Smg protein
VWLTDLTAMAGVEHSLTAASTGTASTEEETDALGGPPSASSSSSNRPKVSPLQREIVIERAGAGRGAGIAGQAQGHRADVALEPGQGADALMFDDLFARTKAPRLLH